MRALPSWVAFALRHSTSELNAQSQHLEFVPELPTLSNFLEFARACDAKAPRTLVLLLTSAEPGSTIRAPSSSGVFRTVTIHRIGHSYAIGSHTVVLFCCRPV